MTFLTKLVGMMGWKSIKSGAHVILPPRLPLMAATSTTSSNLQAMMSSYSSASSTSSSSNRGGGPVVANNNNNNKRSSSSSSSSTSSHQHAKSSTAATATTSTTSSSTTTTMTTTFRYREFWDWRGGDDKKWKYEREDAAAAVAATAGDPSSLISTKPSAGQYSAAVCTAQGYRSYMEDEFFLSADGDFAAVFDGHGGRAVSRYLRKNLYANLQAFLPVLTTTTTPSSTNVTAENNKDEAWSEANNNNNNNNNNMDGPKRIAPSVQDYETALEAALDKVDQEVQRISHWSFQGSTAVAVWVHEEKNSEKNERTIIAANVGDSRAVLCRNGTAWELTRDHKPNDPYEKERIEQLGGRVIWCGDVDKEGEPILERGIYRVNGNLALSRAIGDRSERPHVTAEPEIISVPIVEEEDEFIVLATDGLWDVMHSGEVVVFVKALQEQGHTHEKIATLVVEEALERGTYDNITVVIIWLHNNNHNNVRQSPQSETAPPAVPPTQTP